MILQHNGIHFIRFRNDLAGPKLKWVIMLATFFKLDFIVGFEDDALEPDAFYLRLPDQDRIMEALSLPIAQLDYKALHLDGEVAVLTDDLPNDHVFFRNHKPLEQLVPETPDLSDTDVDILLGKRIEPGGPDPVVVEEPNTMGWDFDDEDEDEDGDPIKNVTPPPPEKKKKEEKIMKTNDPDFEDATADVPLSAPTTGDEYLTVDEALQYTDETFPGVSEPIRMYEAPSSNISAVGAKITKSDDSVTTTYVRFKTGGTLYRYNPVPLNDFNSLLNELIRREQGRQEASGGSFFYHTIRTKGEEGLIKVQRLDDEGRWVNVLPKSERTKAIKKRT